MEITMEILDQLAKFAQLLFVIALPILAAFAARWLHAKAQESLAAADDALGWEFKLEDAAQFAVLAAEQYLKGQGGQAKKEYAIDAASRFLLGYGIKVDLTLIADAIEKAVWTELNRNSPRNESK